VAEERKLEVWDWQLSLPLSRTWQWLIKLACGTVITLVLAWIILPLLNGLLKWVLAGRVDPYSPLPTYSILNILALLMMVSGAYASSLLSDSYKAFFGGWLIFVLAVACAQTTFRNCVLLQPWQARQLGLAPIGVTMRNQVPILIVASSAMLAWLAWFNFRYEGFRWRRLILQLLGLIVFIILATATPLYFEFDRFNRQFLLQDSRNTTNFENHERQYNLKRLRINSPKPSPKDHAGSPGDPSAPKLRHDPF
jgi:hypothetical protein